MVQGRDALIQTIVDEKVLSILAQCSAVSAFSVEAQPVRQALMPPEAKVPAPVLKHHRAAQGRAVLADELLPILGTDRLLAVDAGLEPETGALGRALDDSLKVLAWCEDNGLIALRRRGVACDPKRRERADPPTVGPRPCSIQSTACRRSSKQRRGAPARYPKIALRTMKASA